MNSSYDGPALDGTVQHISEASYWQNDGETVDVIDDEAVGEETTEGVPVPEKPESKPEIVVERPDVRGQSTFDDWEEVSGR